MSVPRTFLQTTLLQDGRLLASSGYSGDQTSFNVTKTAEIYDPASDGSELATSSRRAEIAFGRPPLLPDGLVLLVGVSDIFQPDGSTPEIFDPSAISGPAAVDDFGFLPPNSGGHGCFQRL